MTKTKGGFFSCLSQELTVSLNGREMSISKQVNGCEQPPSKISHDDFGLCLKKVVIADAAEQGKLKFGKERVADTSQGRKAARMKTWKLYHHLHIQYCGDILPTRDSIILYLGLPSLIMFYKGAFSLLF